MDLGLTRVQAVAKRLNVLTPPCAVILVGGTNGKGSSVAALESIYSSAGYQVGCFTSPFLFKMNEQIKINGIPVTDDVLISAFQHIEHSRGDISLTPFEFHTLAALWIFKAFDLDIWILEVGLGGRLDAVNIIDADVAMVTSIAIDHTEWLGSTREAIAYEKSGIFRKNMPAVCGDIDPPNTLVDYADELGASLYCLGRDFHYKKELLSWHWLSHDIHYKNLPNNTLAHQNMATVLMAVMLLQSRLKIQPNAIYQGLANTNLPGRIQIIPGEVTEIYDVSHNPAAVAHLAKNFDKNLDNNLAKNLDKYPHTGRTIAIFSMLADKDIFNSISVIADKIDAWYIAPLAVKRGASIHQLQTAFSLANINPIMFSSIQEAYYQAALNARAGDRLLIFGSFHTVAAVFSAAHHITDNNVRDRKF
jgi:dihydrofolate synthase/folylpolyglutamate synthase